MPKQLDVRMQRLPPCPWCGRAPTLVRRVIDLTSQGTRVAEEAIKLQCPWVHCATSTKEFRTDEADWMTVLGATNPVDAVLREWRSRSVVIPLMVPLPELHFVRRRHLGTGVEGHLFELPPHVLVVLVPYARSLAAHLRSYLEPALDNGSVTSTRFTLREHKIEHEVSLISMNYSPDLLKRTQSWSSFTFQSRGMSLSVRRFNRGNVDVEWLKTKPPVPPILMPNGNKAEFAKE